MNISTLIVAIKLKGEYKIKETVIYTYGGDSIVRMHFDGRFNIADMIVKRKQAQFRSALYVVVNFRLEK